VARSDAPCFVMFNRPPKKWAWSWLSRLMCHGPTIDTETG